MKEYVISPAEIDNSMLVRDAVEYCKNNGISKLRLEKGEYHFYPETAEEDTNCCVSNHGYNGYRRTAFLIKGMENFEVDCSESLLVFHGAMNAFIVRDCRNVSVKGANILFEKTLHGQFGVKAVGEDYVDITPCTPQGYVYENGLLYLENEQGYRNLVYTCVEKNSFNDEFATGEQCFGKDFLYLRNTEVDNNTVRIYNPLRKPKQDNYVILIAAERYSNGILFLESENVSAVDCCIYSCFGIGYHVQLCKNVTIDGCKTDTYEGRCFSANADASHFVGCRGNLVIKNCRFEKQLDDCSYIDTDTWGDEVIYTTPREALDEDRYYHGKIVIRNNDFSNCKKHIIYAENVEEIEFENNRINNITDTEQYRNCGKVSRKNNATS